ncbi:hypothetical protein [Acanthopleuribacter pedis]
MRWTDPLGLCKQGQNRIFQDDTVHNQWTAYKGRKGDNAMDAMDWYKKNQTLAKNKQFYKEMKNTYKTQHNMPDHAKFTTAKNLKLTKELKHWMDYTGPRLAKQAGAERPQIWVHGSVVDQKVLDFAKGKVDIFVF